MDARCSHEVHDWIMFISSLYFRRIYCMYQELRYEIGLDRSNVTAYFVPVRMQFDNDMSYKYHQFLARDTIIYLVCLFVFGATASVGQGLIIYEVSRSHSTTHHSR